MNALIIVMIYTLVIGGAWLLPLYFVCRYARAEKKNFNVVLLVGVCASWIIALIVALLLPRLSDEEFARMSVKTDREPMGQEGMILAGLGAMTVVLVAFMAWMKFGL
jgi:hypothetical protein